MTAVIDWNMFDGIILAPGIVDDIALGVGQRVRVLASWKAPGGVRAPDHDALAQMLFETGQCYFPFFADTNRTVTTGGTLFYFDQIEFEIELADSMSVGELKKLIVDSTGAWTMSVYDDLSSVPEPIKDVKEAAPEGLKILGVSVVALLTLAAVAAGVYIAWRFSNV